MRILFITFLILSICQCSDQNLRSDLKTVHGEIDNRVDVRSSEAPYSYIGRLDSGCTGNLVGPGMIVTSLHCFLDEENDNKWRDDVCYFRPNLQGPTNDRLVSPDRSLVKRVWYTQRKGEDINGQPDTKNDRGQDWAIVELDKKLGEKYGFFSISDQSFFKNTSDRITLSKMVRLLGYSADKIRLNDKDELLPLLNGNDRRDGYTPSEDPSCSITNYAFQEGNPLKRYLLHNCKETRGASGGPLFHRREEIFEILAIQGADFPGDDYQPDYVKPGSDNTPNANVAIPAEHFAKVHSELSEILMFNNKSSTKELLNYLRDIIYEHEDFDSELELKVHELKKGPNCKDLPKVPVYKKAPERPLSPMIGQKPAPTKPQIGTNRNKTWKIGISYVAPAESPHGIEAAYVMKIVPGSPADKIGLRPGYYIESINGTNLYRYFLENDFWVKGQDGKVREKNAGNAISTLLMQTNGVIDITFLRLTQYNSWERVSRKSVQLLTAEQDKELVDRHNEKVRTEQAKRQRIEEERKRALEELYRLQKVREQQIREKRAMLTGNIALIAYNSFASTFGSRAFTARSANQITIPANYGFQSVNNGCVAMLFGRFAGGIPTSKYAIYSQITYYQDYFEEYATPRDVEKAAKYDAEQNVRNRCNNQRGAGIECFGLVSACSTY